MSIALLIIDVQQEYAKMPGFKERLDKASEYINYVSGLFRNAQKTVIHIQHANSEEFKKTDGFNVSDKIVQEDGDIYVHKAFGNGFWKTELESILQEREVDFVVCCGLSALHCVLGTYNGALERGFGAVLLQNGLVARTDQEIDVAQSLYNVTSHNMIQYLLKENE